MAGAKQNNKKQSFPQKAKMTKEERRAKYTRLAREREDKRRRQQRSTHLICYNCRQKGHAVADCPQNNDTTINSEQNQKLASTSTRMCYKCGSLGHSLSTCPKRSEGDDLPYCHCFICDQKGHLSKNCPQNDHGIFVNGGQCKSCGSTSHTSKDCPERDTRQKKGKSYTGEPDIDGDTLLQGEGDEVTVNDVKTSHATEKKNKKQRTSKPRRVVNF